nr:reverse transcriptase domain-containing protein [Tanacetum cinerariifolium]
MRTRNSYFPNNSSVTILMRRNKRRTPNVVKPELRTIVQVAPMADNRTMGELLQAPTEGEAWERFKEMLRACPHHGFTELAQIDTFYNGLNDNDQDSLNAAAGGNLLSKTTREALQIIENKSKVRYSRNKPNVSRMNTTSRENASKIDDRTDKLADQISTLVDIFAKKVVTPAPVKAVEESCVTCGGAHAYYNCPNTESNQPSICVATGTYNQVAPQNLASNYMASPGFAPIQNSQNRFNQNQRQRNNFHGNQPFQVPNQGFQNQPFKVPNNLVQQGEFKNEIQNIMKTQQTVLMEQQNAFQNNLQNMLSGFFQNQASTSGTLLSNTIPNPKGEIKAITTRSGVAYEGPSIPTNHSPKKTLPKPNIPYPSRLNDQKLHEKATNQMEKFFQIFQDLHFDISFMDALLLMPKFASTTKSLLTNKDKLFVFAKIPLNENCSTMLLKKLPKKHGDPGKFLIPCDFPRMDVCHALADLDASINLMQLSIWKKLSLSELTPTRMNLELADRSITRPNGVAEDIFVKVGKFHFLTDFVVVDFEVDPRVPLILGRSFLRTDRALIDVYGEEITLRVNDEAITFNLNQTTRYSSTYDDLSVNRIDIIDVSKEEYAYEILGFSNNSSGGNPTSTSEPILSDSSLLRSREVNPQIHEVIKKEVIKLLDARMIYPISDSPWVSLIHCVPKKGGITIVENENNELIPTRLVTGWRVCIDYRKLNDATFNPPDQEKTTFTCPYGTFAYCRMPFGLCNAPGTFQRPMTHLLEKEIPFVFSKDCIDAFETLKKKLTEALILVVPDWNLPFELMCDASDFETGSVLGQRKTKHFQPIHYANKTMTEAQIHYTTTEKEMLAVVYAFEKFRPYLVLSKSIVYTDHSALKYLLSKQDAKLRLENPHKDVFENKDINESFPLETLGKISSGSTPWFANFANFHARNFIVKGMSSKEKKKFFKDVKHYFWDDPYFFGYVRIKSFEGVCMAKKLMISSKLVIKVLPGAIMVPISPSRKYLMPVSFGLSFIEMLTT